MTTTPDTPEVETVAPQDPSPDATLYVDEQGYPILSEHYLRPDDLAPQVGDQVPLELLGKPTDEEIAPVGDHVNPPPADSVSVDSTPASQDGVNPDHVMLGDPSLAQPTEQTAPSSAVDPEPLDTDTLVVPVSSDGGHTGEPPVALSADSGSVVDLS